ncbi:hypothetical protein KAFR_0A08460 [Kazachstania africana CBS 2517]|uniref:DNL-type domain-containing protein n=1 Tax=Kazachstania africana (strain ATCC 22294 / BCRC 22015 / CBS 2517 / CECT 1963 / NBRC 1671 / NRRL Y-8276) TaxID=1071382 RepID=H2API0_KAZAF|nr:hypothetical protein KAFR_0A08460 [Kazachstania africana CBS 2517]CCF56280.1 hypothetical protein KAFR_0A08460 [Kazachstania africana CBS 2517]
MSVVCRRGIIGRVVPRISLLSRTYAPVLHLGYRATQTAKFGTIASYRYQQNNDFKHLGSFKVDQPKLMLAFTCKKCNNRSSHVISKQAYTKGTVLVTCPDCKNRHLIADHLKIFDDNHITIEDILKLKGESVSTSTDDLIFDEIPDALKESIGHYAKDAPAHLKKQLDNTTIHSLPHNED